MRKSLTLFLFFSMTLTSPQLRGECNNCDECYYEFYGDMGSEYACDPCCTDPCDYGCGYRSSVNAPCRFVCIVIAAALFGAMIAIGIHDANGSHGHH